MTLAEIAGWAAMLLNLWGNLSLISKSKTGWIVRLVSNVGWVAYSVHTGAWALLANHLTFAVVNIVGWVRWSREDEPQPSDGKLRVYLDDERATPDGWIRVYWPDQAIALLQTGLVEEISLDHDLGDDAKGTGYDVVLWIEEQVFTASFQPPFIKVHSANTSARRKMEAGIAAIERQVSYRNDEE